MRALTVLTVGVSLVLGLQAMDSGSAADFDTQYAAARSAVKRQDFAGAARFFEQCVGLARSYDERATALASYGIVLHRTDQNREAKLALEQALGEAAKLAGPWTEHAIAAAELAAVYRSLGDYDNAERGLRAAIADPLATPAERAGMMVSLADILREESRESDARTVLEEASRLPGLPWPRRIDVLVETAELDRESHMWNASLALWNEIGQIQRRENSTRFDGVIAGGLGETWFWSGNLARAEPLLRRSLQLIQNDPTATVAQVATALAVLANLYLDEDKLALAGELLEEAIAKDEAALGRNHPQIAALYEMRASMLSRRGEAQAARDELDRARSIMISHFGPESIPVAGIYSSLGEVELRASQPAAAALEYGIAMRLFRGAGPDSAKYADALVPKYAAALKAAHRPDEAKALLRAFQARARVAAAGTAVMAGFREK